jgi:hypothetical protein
MVTTVSKDLKFLFFLKKRTPLQNQRNTREIFIFKMDLTYITTNTEQRIGKHQIDNLLLAQCSCLLKPFLLYPKVSRFVSFILIILQTVGLLGWVISPSQGLYLNTGQDKHRKNKYPCLVWDSKPRSQLPSERSQNMP